MPRKRFALQEGERPRLEVSSKFPWREILVSLDGAHLAGPYSRVETEIGQHVDLPDGSTLTVVMNRTWLLQELEVYRNGVALPGSGADPQKRMNTASTAVLLVAGINLLLGLAVVLLDIRVLKEAGMNVGSVIYGAVFLILGILVTRRSRVALGIALGLYVLDSIYTIFVGLGSNAGNLFIRIFFIIFMFRGFEAIAVLREGDAARAKEERTPALIS